MKEYQMPAQWKFAKLGSTVLSCCLLAACSGVLESSKPARQVYMLHPPSSSSDAMAVESPAALIMSVRAVPGLDTDRILVLGADARLNPVANAHWSDNMPEVFTSVIRRYLSDTNQFGAVKEGTIARPGDWLMELELQAFYGTQTSGGNTNSVALQMEGWLRCGGGQHVFSITQETSASGDSLSGLVAAHQRVLDKALIQLPAKITESCDATE